MTKIIKGENSIYPPEVLGVFQFELQSFKIGSLPSEVSKSGNLNLPSTFFVELDEKL
jgi:hypothetical protein